MIIFYFHLSYFHILNSALFSSWYLTTLILYRRGLDTLYLNPYYIVIEEWTVHVIQGMYSNARIRVQVNGQHSEEFGMGVCVLSSLLFMLVLGALSREFHTGVLWELLNAGGVYPQAQSVEGWHGK